MKRSDFKSAFDLQKSKNIIVEHEQVKQTVLNYVLKNGPVKGDCVQIAWNLYDTLHLTVGAMNYLMRRLLNSGELTYVNGTYIIADKDVM